MSNTTFNTAKAYLPEDYGNLLIATASKLSIGLQTTSIVTTDSSEFRIPLVTKEADADWYAEGVEIAVDDATLAEVVARPRKVAGLSKISNELANDSNPAAQAVIGDSIGRSIATKIDAALFGSADGSGVQPRGLGDLADAQIAPITAATAWTNIDPFIEAQFKVDASGGNITAFIANPQDAELLAKLKREAGSNEPLLAPDANSETRRSIAGVALYTSTAIPVGTVYGYDKTHVFTVIRKDVSVEFDRSAYFSSDSAAVRAVARLDFAYANPKSIARITLSE